MRPGLTALACAAFLSFASPAPAQVVLDESFTGPATGWTTGTEWQIGVTSVGPAPVEGTYPDPAQDHSAGADNRVAGTVLGGNVTASRHDYRWLTSPAVDVGAWNGGVQLRFWRWLNIDYAPYMSARVEVFNGTSWIVVWENGTQSPVTDNTWNPQVLDLTPYKNANLRVRFGHANPYGGGFSFSGWNLDDVQIEQVSCGDDDGDGYTKIGCGGNDCNDSDPAIHPGAADVCDGKDNDCDGIVDPAGALYYLDLDGDGFGNPNVSQVTCPQPSSYVPVGGDCNDGDPAIHPGAPEQCDGKDNDCDGQVDEDVTSVWYFDQDHDGYGRPIAPYLGCAPPAGYVAISGDCDDTRANVHPGAVDYCDVLDNDCDGQVDEGCNYFSIESIRDVGSDQGGNIRATWVRAADDSVGIANPVTSYSIWRRVQNGMAARATTPSSLSSDGIASFPPGAWDFVTSIPAVARQRYQTVIPTLCDSTSAGVCWTVLLLLAHKDPPNIYADAPLDSGYSVDNVIPVPPAGVLVQFTPGGAQLAWDECPAPDFQEFRVYRGTDAGFLADAAHRVTTTAEPGWTDPAGAPGSIYKVTAADSSGNESEPTTASATTGIGDAGILRTAITGIAPNPAAQGTAIQFGLSSAAEIRLEVLDLAGRVVQRIAAASWPAGRHELRWNGRDARGNPVASGIYVVRLTAGGVRDTRRVVIAR